MEGSFQSYRKASRALLGAAVGASGSSGLSKILRSAKKKKLHKDVQNFAKMVKDRRALVSIAKDLKAGNVPPKKFKDLRAELMHFKNKIDNNPLMQVSEKKLQNIATMFKEDYGPIDRTLFGYMRRKK